MLDSNQNNVYFTHVEKGSGQGFWLICRKKNSKCDLEDFTFSLTVHPYGKNRKIKFTTDNYISDVPTQNKQYGLCIKNTKYILYVNT